MREHIARSNKATNESEKTSGLLCSVCFIIVLFFTVYTSQAQTRKEKLQKDKQKIENDIAYTNKLLSETKKNAELNLNALVILNKKISQREALISAINEEIELIDQQMAEKSKEIDLQSKELKELKEEYGRLIYYAYKNRDNYDRMMFIFSSKDFNQAYLRLKYLQYYTLYRKKEAELIVKQKAVLARIVNELAKEKASKEVLLANLEKEKNTLAQDKNQKSKSISKLKEKEKDLKATLKEKEAKARRLQNAIEQLITAEIKKAKTTKKNTTKTTANKLPLTPEETLLSNSFANNKGRLPWPSESGMITGTFGIHAHPVLSGVKIKNNGVDIATTKGSKARAVFEGTVSQIVSIPGYNNVVILRHGDYLSVYSNLTDVYVKIGDNIKTKQNIGLIYTDLNEAKTELHLEIWQDIVIQNPADWLAR